MRSPRRLATIHAFLEGFWERQQKRAAHRKTLLTKSLTSKPLYAPQRRPPAIARYPQTSEVHSTFRRVG